MRGETARATGWFSRGDRLLAQLGRDCVEHGYLLIPAMLPAEVSGDSTNREAMDGFAQVAAGVAEFFSDENAGRIFAAAA
jgi:hypothetical protein